MRKEECLAIGFLSLPFQLCHSKNKSRFSALVPHLEGNKISGKSCSVSESANKSNTCLRTCPAIEGYLKGGKEQCGMVTFQLVKQKSMDMK